jgi:ATP-binding protein involved in chromosome partitioning
MNRNELKKIFANVLYPHLDKSIDELKLIRSVDQKDGNIYIKLTITRDDIFEIVKKDIEKRLSKKFDKVIVENINNSFKKSMNYGTTQAPNNRASYAKNIIAVTSGKGGVGKSTVAVNIAVGLAQKGYRVGLLDADIYGPNTARMLGVENEKMRWNENDKIIPSENFGIKVMSVALTTPKSDTPLVWRSSVAISALIQFLEDVDWGELDYMVIDMPPGTGDVQLTMAQELPISGAVIVSTPQQVAVDDVSRAIMMFKETNIKIVGVVENMSFFIAPDTQARYDIFGSSKKDEICKKYDIGFLGSIPLDIGIREASDSGKPPVAVGSSEQKEYYRVIVDNLLKSL